MMEQPFIFSAVLAAQKGIIGGADGPTSILVASSVTGWGIAGLGLTLALVAFLLWMWLRSRKK